MDDEKLLRHYGTESFLERCVADARRDVKTPLTQAYLRMYYAKKISLLWSKKQKREFYQAQMEFVKVLLRIIKIDRKKNTTEEHLQNLIFFSSFISSENIRLHINVVKNISFKCVKIASVNESKLGKSEAFIFRNSLKEFYVPEIITFPVNEEIMSVIMKFMDGTLYTLEAEWFEFYKRRLYRYKMLNSQSQ